MNRNCFKIYTAEQISYERRFTVKMKLSVGGEEQEIDTEFVPYEIKDISNNDLEMDTAWFNKPQTWILILVVVMTMIMVYACVKRSQNRRGNLPVNADFY